jgi:KDO2-lipid IV(A) lauroyltransferase
MKKLVDYISNGVLLLLGVVSRNINMKYRTQLGIATGNVLRLLSKERAGITFENIRISLPTLGAETHLKICKESYQNLGITLVELLAFPEILKKDIEKYIKFNNFDLIMEAYNRGKGLIFLSGHFGNWELTALAVGLYTKIPVTVVVKPQSNKISDKYLNEFRSLGGNKMLPMSKAARTIIQTIKQKGAIALLVDQSADWQKDVFVDFFGRPAATYEAPAVIALKYRCPLIVGFAHRQEDNSYLVRVEEIDYSDLDDSKESIIELTKRHVKILEDNIRLNPGHWAWQHKRWKHDPPGTQNANS